MTAASPRPPRARRGILPTSREALAAFASGALFAFAFPPFNFVLPALFCLVPVTIAVAWYADREGHAWNAARAGFWFGAVGYGANLYWIAVALLLYTKLALLGYLGTLVWLAPMVAAAMTALFVARRFTGWSFAILLPVVWTASELSLNYLSDLSFPWLPLGLSVAHIPVLAQVADLSGVRGVSFATSLGFSVRAETGGMPGGGLESVVWDGLAFKAGITPDMQMQAVNDQKYTPAVLREAILAAEKSKDPIKLLLKRGDEFVTVSLDYHGGMRYPHLERVESTPDRLDAILAPAK